MSPPIAWEVYERNRQLIEHNAHIKGTAGEGGSAPRAQPAPRVLPVRPLWPAAACYLLGYQRLCAALWMPRGCRQSWYRRLHLLRRPPRGRAIEWGILRTLSPGAIETVLATAVTIDEERTACRRALDLEPAKDDDIQPGHLGASAPHDALILVITMG